MQFCAGGVVSMAPEIWARAPLNFNKVSQTGTQTNKHCGNSVQAPTRCGSLAMPEPRPGVERIRDCGVSLVRGLDDKQFAFGCVARMVECLLVLG